MKNILVTIREKGGCTVARVQCSDQLTEKEILCAIDALKRSIPAPAGRLVLSEKESERFWSNIEKTETCWLWKGCKDKDGYGKFLLRRKHLRAHRVSYWIANGPIANGLVACHRCDTPSCVNPDHLFAGTFTENNRDAWLKGRHAFGDRHGTKTHPETVHSGESHYKAGVTNTQAEEIRKEYANGTCSQRELAKKYGIPQCSIWMIIHRRAYKNANSATGAK